MPTDTPALLVLEDGTAFRGTSFGAAGTTFGEAVFNTGMTGYEEILTDPSYRGQIVTMTTSHVGNYGWTGVDGESDDIQVRGFVVREAARRTSNWRAVAGLREVLTQRGIVAIEQVDTRRLTRHIREIGAMRCGISTELLEPEELLASVLESPSMEGADLAKDVTTPEPYVLEPAGDARYHVVALDYGMKKSIARLLTEQGCRVEVLPASTTADEVLDRDPDGVFLSNGPGDPAAVTYGVDTTRKLLGQKPMFGICLGSQLMGLALGGSTFKLQFGHHGINVPVLRREDGAVEITSQNHGFAVDESSLGEAEDEHTFQTADHGRVSVTHINMNDDTVAGLALQDVDAFSVQYHPEAAPGPHDSRYLFERFAAMMDARA